MANFKFTNTVDGDDDAVFVQAENETAARGLFRTHFGIMPASMLKVEELAAIPEGEDVLVA